MSLAIDIFKEINTAANFSDLVSEFGFSDVFIVELPGRQDNQNPYVVIPRVPRLVERVKGDKIRTVSDSEKKSLFGVVEATFFWLFVETCSVNTSHYVAVSYADSLSFSVGKVARVDRRLNGSIKLYVETATNVPFSIDKDGVIS